MGQQLRPPGFVALINNPVFKKMGKRGEPQSDSAGRSARRSRCRARDRDGGAEWAAAAGAAAGWAAGHRGRSRGRSSCQAALARKDSRALRPTTARSKRGIGLPSPRRSKLNVSWTCSATQGIGRSEPEGYRHRYAELPLVVCPTDRIAERKCPHPVSRECRQPRASINAVPALVREERAKLAGESTSVIDPELTSPALTAPLPPCCLKISRSRTSPIRKSAVLQQQPRSGKEYSGSCRPGCRRTWRGRRALWRKRSQSSQGRPCELVPVSQPANATAEKASFRNAARTVF